MKNRTWVAIAALATMAASLTFSSPSAASTEQTFAKVKQVLGAADVGQTPGDDYGTADVSAITLPDGRIRLYFGIINGAELGQVGSAISTDGLNFTREPGIRVPEAASPMAFISKDGKFHLFYIKRGGIMSSTSTDGLNFTEDPGMRLPRDAFVKVRVRQNSNLLCQSLAEMPDGRYRMYCADQVQLQGGWPQAVADRAIFSAVSSDLMNWTPEPGRRIGPGTNLPGDANHPSIFKNSNGTVTLIYEQRLENVDGREMIATSTDGLNFTSEYFSGIYGNEASYTPGKDGTGFLYVGHHNKQDGSTIDVATPGPINLDNQRYSKALTCLALDPANPTQVIIAFAENPICPNTHYEKGTTPTARPTPGPTGAAITCIAQLPGLTPQTMTFYGVTECPKDYKLQESGAVTPTPTATASPTPTPTFTPTPTPTITPVIATVKKTTITCVKGKTVKKVTGTNPKCPSGYKKR